MRESQCRDVSDAQGMQNHPSFGNALHFLVNSFKIASFVLIELKTPAS